LGGRSLEGSSNIMKIPVLWIAAVALVVGAGALWAVRRPATVEQPIAFPHAVHVKKVELECASCHPGATTSFHSQLPTLELCLECHEEKLSDNPEEAKIRQLAKENPQPEFRKLFVFPNHVFYSHRRHVVVAKIPCERCHGAIAETSTPPRRPLVHITMQYCLDCHRKRGASQDCIECHR